jgi:hypothetical protein
MHGDPLAEIYGMTSDADNGSFPDISAGAAWCLGSYDGGKSRGCQNNVY